MKTRNKWLAISTAALALILAIAVTVQAGPFGRGKRGDGFGPHGPGMRGELGALRHVVDLSEAQHDAIKTIRSEYRPQLKELREALHETRESTRELVDAGEYEKAFAAGLEIREKMFVTRAEMMNKVKDVLTEEQLAALDERRSEAKARMKHRLRDCPCE